MKPNFKNIDIYAGFQPQNGMKWQKENGITADRARVGIPLGDLN